MGSGVPRGRPPSHVAYYVALAGVALLLVLLLSYCLYYMLQKAREVSKNECSPLPSSSRRPAPLPDYPVTAGARESAAALAKLCKTLPAAAPDIVLHTLDR